MATENNTPAQPAAQPVTQPAAPAAAPDAYDAMASVFDELLVVPEPSTTQVEGETPPADSSAPAPAAPAAVSEGDAPPAVETPAAAPTAPAADGTTPPPAAVDSPPPETDWKKRAEELEAQLRAAKEPPKQEAPAPAAEQPKPAPIYNEDEQSFIAKYEEDWPDISKAEALKRKGEYHAIVEHIFNEIGRVWGPLLERGNAAAETVAENTTVELIRSVHDDYDDALYDDVHKWVGTLTGIKRRIAEQTISEGEPEDVIELISEFKSATGRKPRVVADPTPAAAPSAAPAAPVASVTDISAAAKKAASAMGVVDSKRTVQTTAADPNDFNSAWEEAVSGSK